MRILDLDRAFTHHRVLRSKKNVPTHIL